MNSLLYRIGGAIAALLIGWLVARLLQRVTRASARRMERVLPPAHRTTVGRSEPSQILARAVFWLTLVLAIMAATEILGLPVVSAWLSGVASYLPRILVAVLIALGGVVIARIARNAIERTALQVDLHELVGLGRVSEVAIIAASLLVAIEQLGIGFTFVTTALSIALAALLGAAALAFGLGGRDVVSQILAAHYAQKIFAVGQRIRHDGTEGEIIRMTAVSVVIECDDGEVVVPAKALLERATTLMARAQVER